MPEVIVRKGEPVDRALKRLKNKLDGYLQWAKANNSLLIVTTDEEETDTHPSSNITTIVNGDPDLFVASERKAVLRAFHPSLQPLPHRQIVDVHELNADRA